MRTLAWKYLKRAEWHSLSWSIDFHWQSIPMERFSTFQLDWITLCSRQDTPWEDRKSEFLQKCKKWLSKLSRGFSNWLAYQSQVFTKENQWRRNLPYEDISWLLQNQLAACLHFPLSKLSQELFRASALSQVLVCFYFVLWACNLSYPGLRYCWTGILHISYQVVIRLSQVPTTTLFDLLLLLRVVNFRLYVCVRFQCS